MTAYSETLDIFLVPGAFAAVFYEKVEDGWLWSFAPLGGRPGARSAEPFPNLSMCRNVARCVLLGPSEDARTWLQQEVELRELPVRERGEAR